MKILSYYIARTVISTTLLALLVLIAMQMFIQFVTEIQDIGTGQYGLLQTLIYVPLMMPTNVYQFFPVAALIGTLMGLGRLANQSELIVMRAAGVSKAQIIGAVIKAALFMLVIITLVGEWLAPPITNFATRYKSMAMSSGQMMQSSEGIWLRQKQNFFHIAKIDKHNQLSDITYYQFSSNHQLQAAGQAASGTYVKGKWLLSQVKVSEFMPKKVVVTTLPQQVSSLQISPQLLGVGKIQTQQQSLVGLYKYIRFRLNGGLNAEQYQFAFWQRLFQPLSTIVMICLAVPFIFGPLRSVSMGVRILTGIVFGFAFYVLNAFFGPITMVDHLSPVLAAIAPTLLFAAMGGWMLYKSW